MRLVMIDNYDSFTYNLVQYLGELGAPIEVFRNTVIENPGEITILAVGPLTNIALAIRREPRFAASVKQMVIMGGAIASLADGAGNQTPNAEFNFWVAPSSPAAT